MNAEPVDDLDDDFAPVDPIELAVRGDRAPTSDEVAAFVDASLNAITRAAWGAVHRDYADPAPLLSILLEATEARARRARGPHTEPSPTEERNTP